MHSFVPTPHPAKNLRLGLALLAACALLPASAGAVQMIVSTENGATLGGVTFRDGDLVAYDTVTGTASLYFSEDLFSANENVDSVFVRSDNKILLSTVGGATLGGLTFEDGDVVLYDPGTNTSTLFFDEDLFSNDEDIDAFALLANGHYVLSTEDGATLAGLVFRDGDLVEYDPLSATASIFLSEDLFSANEDIDGVRVMANGLVILTTEGGATIGGLTFRDGDVIAYNRTTDTATLVFDEDAFSGNENVDAVFGPEPATGLLLALGLGVLAYRRRQ
jgi:hypothetical protein